jgi:uncharacterized repeat protein (TIGR03943 family)
MKKSLPRLFQSLIVAGTALLIAVMLLSGKISWYIHNRFNFLMIFAIVCLGTMSALSLRNFLNKPADDAYHSQSINISEIFVLAIPLTLALIIPARPLSANAVSTRGTTYTAPGSLPAAPSESAFSMTPDERNIMDWLRAFNTGKDINALVGERANVIGFVYRDEENFPGQNTFMVGRFVITCCAADAFPLGIPVVWDDAKQLTDDTWVQVQGVVESIEINNMNIPLIRADSVQTISVPEQPYLFP